MFLARKKDYHPKKCTWKKKKTIEEVILKKPLCPSLHLIVFICGILIKKLI